MATYGIQVNGANNQVIVDSNPNSAGNFTELLTISSGPNVIPTSSALTSAGSVSWAYDEVLLFVRPANTYSKVQAFIWGNTLSIIINSLNNPIKYFLATKTSQVPNYGSAGEYGIEVYDTSTPQNVIFSSRRAESAVNVRAIFEPYATLGRANAAGNTTIFQGSVNSNTYVGTGLMWDGGAQYHGRLTFNSNSIVYGSHFNLGTLPGGGGASSLPNPNGLYIVDLIT